MDRRNIPVVKSLVLLFLFLDACGPSEIRPIDIFPEDMCSQCRMAFSDPQFAAEIITDQQEVFKFDDIGCMVKFRTKRPGVKAVAIFLKDYDTKEWIPFERATLVETTLDTPMGSGIVAFADPAKAGEFKKSHSSGEKER